MTGSSNQDSSFRGVDDRSVLRRDAVFRVTEADISLDTRAALFVRCVGYRHNTRLRPISCSFLDQEIDSFDHSSEGLARLIVWRVLDSVIHIGPQFRMICASE